MTSRAPAPPCCRPSSCIACRLCLASRGCVTGGWEEAAHGDVHREGQKLPASAGATVEVSAKLAGEGYDMVVAPGQRYYLDMANGIAWSEPGAGWAGWSRRRWRPTSST